MADSPQQRHEGLLCPACRVDLVMSERQGIEIDYCPKCRGVWLDRGELDKIIERSGQEDRARSSVEPPSEDQARPSFMPQAGTPTPWGGVPQGSPQPGPPPYSDYPPQGGRGYYDAHQGGSYDDRHGGGHGGGHGRNRGFLGRLFD